MRILDVHYDNLRYDDAVAKAVTHYGRATPALITYLNIDCLRIADRNADYRAALDRMDMVLPDGIGIRLATLFGGARKTDHWIGTDAFISLIGELVPQGARFYFLGGPEGVAQAAAEKLRERWPAIAVVGTRNGFFSDDAAVIADINASGADVVIVGTGAPRQELWLLRHHAELKPQLRVAVGALFNWISGYQPRAPVWARRLHLEWLWRVLLEPKRLFRRYFLEDLPFLIGLIFRRVKAVPGSAERP